MSDIFDNSGSVDPSLFGEGQSTDTGAESQSQNTATEGQNQTQDPAQAPSTEGQAQEKVFAGKFKSADDLEKSYLESQKALTKAHMELAEIRKANPAPQQDNSQTNDDFDLVSWFDQAYQINPAQAISQLSQYIAQQTTQQAVDQALQPFQGLQKEYQFNQEINQAKQNCPDFDSYFDGIVEVFQSRPDVFELPGTKKYEMAYHIAKANAHEQMSKAAYENGKNDALKIENQKQTNVFENSKGIPQENNPDSDIINGIMGAGSTWKNFGI